MPRDGYRRVRRSGFCVYLKAHRPIARIYVQINTAYHVARSLLTSGTRRLAAAMLIAPGSQANSPVFFMPNLWHVYTAIAHTAIRPWEDKTIER